MSFKSRALLVFVALLALTVANVEAAAAKPIRAGAVSIDITPTSFPVIVNGGFLEKQATKANDQLHARAVVLDDGQTRVAICVVDTCMMMRELIDDAKAMASKATGIPTERMLVSATHTHSAPSAMSCLGTRLDTNYAAYLPGKIAEAIAGAAKNLQPARVGWAVVPAWEYTNCRRWIRRPDKLITDPFGVVSARANMHPGNLNPDAIGPSGPIDPDLSILSVQTRDGRPLALLANFSMHYFGAGPLSADYFGAFANGIGKLIGAREGEPFVGIMSQGTSGDSQWRDYADRVKTVTTEQYSGGLMQLAAAAYKKIEHHDSAPIAMAEAKLKLGRRVADESRLAWARKIAGPMGDRVATNQVEVYAREQLYIAAAPERELKLQALRIGELGITAIPNEVYAITGLKLKAQSPLRPTFNIELANGSEGYIPPPEQHKLGGYTTWAARTAGLVPEAEPRIVETVLGLLEKVSGEKRRKVVDENGPYAQAVLAAKPLAYWRMSEFVPPTAYDASGNKNHATYDWEHGVAFHLLGAGNGMGASSQPSLATTTFSGPNQLNRSPHFAGGSMKAELKKLGADYTCTFWLWNGLDPKARATTGIAFTRGSERLGITGTSSQPGRLFFAASTNAAPLVGKTELLWKDWHHIALVREGRRVTAYLDGQPGLSGEAEDKAGGVTLFFGGRVGDGSTLEGKIDEAAVFNRVLTPVDIAAQYQVSGPPPRATVVTPPPSAPKTAHVDMAAPKFPAAYDAVLKDLKPAVHQPLRTPKKEFAGQRVSLEGAKISGGTYSASFCFRNNLGNSERAVTAYLFSRGPDGNLQAPGDHLGIGGSFRSGYEGKLLFYNGNESHQTALGRTAIAPGSWNHVVLVRDGARVTAYLNGQLETSGDIEVTAPSAREFFLGARSDNFAPLQGGLAEFAMFDRALKAEEVTQLFKAVEVPVARPVVTSAPPAPASPPKLEVPPTSPQDSLKKIHVPEGFTVELVAAESLVKDPVAIDWDERGRLWVVEMADYPLGMDNNGKPGGRLRVLEDTDGDGRYDKSTLVADGLSFPNGLLTWRDGVLVTAAPDILFVKDSTGDGIADIREPLFQGFFEGNQQLRVNGLRWGLDNWVYCAIGAHHGNYGKNLLRSKLTGAEFDLGARDFRIRPDTGALEPQSGPTQFGRNRDAWGHWFGTQNSWPLWHYVLADQYLRRNPHVAAPDPVRQIVTPANPQVYPASRLEKRFHSFSQSGHFTSACAGMIYNDDLLFGGGSEEHAFTCEPFHNLVQHNVLTDDGVSFAFHRAKGEETVDFFASEDRWCRPVMTRTGPDGALWVVDMYRYMIEHPQFLPPEGKAELLPHYRAGDDRGRIYRVFPKNQPPRKPVRFEKLGAAELVAALNTPNGWQRDKAQQLLVWRNDKSASPHLEKLARDAKDARVRLQALCTLDGLGALKPELVERALGDTHPGVRENALRLGETRGTPGVIAAAVKLTGDSNLKVRLQLAFSLGEWKDPRAGEALGRLAVANHADRFITAAVMSSAAPHAEALVGAVMKAGGSARDALADSLLSLAFGLNQRAAIARLLEPTLASRDGRFSDEQMEGFGRFLDLLAQRKMTLASLSESGGGDELAKRLHEAEAMFAFARQSASDESKPAGQRATAAALLARAPSQRAEAMSLLTGWLTPRTAGELQRAAVRSLAATGDDSVPAKLMSGWASHAPATRNAILDALMGREPWAFALVQRLEKGELTPSDFDPTRRAQLLRHASARVRGKAGKFLNAAGTSNRAKVVEEFRPALALKGNGVHGREVYLKLCVNCHKLGDTGNEIGPDLRSVVEHPPEKLLFNILDPSGDVQPGFNAYSCTLANGEELYGLITVETGNSLTFKLADGTVRNIPRRDVASLRGSNLSLMPEGLENGLTKQDVADLIQFLRTPRADTGTSGGKQ
ncbi:MAG: c-type cytochrome [Verrucomicrobia bacterium]|nr:c-type cytochrome [Verrucomicrobiota bacterium]